MFHITLRQLTVVRTIAETGKITLAAKTLGLTGPALTLSLKQMEEQLGASLFDRTSDGMLLTAAGEVALQAANQIDESLRNLRDQIDSLKGVRRGTLRLGVASTAKYFAPRMISAFLKIHPGIELKLTVGNRERTIDDLRHHAVDIVLMGRPPRDIPVRASVFGDHPLVIVAPADHPLTKRKDITRQEIAKENFIIREAGSGTRISLEMFFSSVPEKLENLGTVMDSNETIKQAVIAGLGIAFISAHTIEQELETGKLAILNVEGMPIRRQWYTVSRADRHETPVMAAFNQFMIRNGPSLLPMIAKTYPLEAVGRTEVFST